MFKLGKIARKNLVGLLRSFNLQASKVNKQYAGEPNFQPVPTYTLDEFMSNVSSRADYRRETDRLKRFFKKNRRDSQDKVYVNVGGEVFTVVNWMYREQKNIRRAEKAKINKAKKAKDEYDSDSGASNFPPAVPETPTTNNFKAQQQQYADSSLEKLVNNYIKALTENGWAQTPEGQQVIKIVKKLYEEFDAFLESLLWGGGEGDGSIDFCYRDSGGSSGDGGYIAYYSGLTGWQSKVNRMLNYWNQKLIDAGIDYTLEYEKGVELGVLKEIR